MSALKLTEGLCEELLSVIGKYAESMPLVSVLGVLEVVKAQLIANHMEEGHD